MSRCCAGEWRLCLAIGKSAGVVAVWASPSFSSIETLQGMTGGEGLCSASMGSSTVVGLAWTAPPVQGQEAAVVLTAAGQDGSLSSWKLARQEVCPKCTCCLSQDTGSVWNSLETVLSAAFPCILLDE